MREVVETIGEPTTNVSHVLDELAGTLGFAHPLTELLHAGFDLGDGVKAIVAVDRQPRAFQQLERIGGVVGATQTRSGASAMTRSGFVLRSRGVRCG